MDTIKENFWKIFAVLLLLVGGLIALLVVTNNANEAAARLTRDNNEAAARLTRDNIELQLKRDTLRVEQALKQAELDKGLEIDCQKRISTFKCSNCEGGGYNKFLEYCEISYKDIETKEIVSANINDMIDAN